MRRIRIPQTVVLTIGAISLGVLGGVAAIACTGSDDNTAASTVASATTEAATNTALAQGDLQEAENDLKVIAADLIGSADADAQAEHHDDDVEHHDDAEAQAEHHDDDDVEHHDDADAQAERHEDDDAEHHDAELDADGARTINVVMEDFAFGPREIHVKVGETVKLVLRNEGTVLHDFTVTEFAGEAQAVTTAEHEDSTAHAHGDAPGLHAAAVAAAEAVIVFTATEAGTYDVFCSVPGHTELGMTAVLIVEA